MGKRAVGVGTVLVVVRIRGGSATAALDRTIPRRRHSSSSAASDGQTTVGSSPSSSSSDEKSSVCLLVPSVRGDEEDKTAVTAQTNTGSLRSGSTQTDDEISSGSSADHSVGQLRCPIKLPRIARRHRRPPVSAPTGSVRVRAGRDETVAAVADSVPAAVADPVIPWGLQVVAADRPALGDQIAGWYFGALHAFVAQLPLADSFKDQLNGTALLVRRTLLNQTPTVAPSTHSSSWPRISGCTSTCSIRSAALGRRRPPCSTRVRSSSQLHHGRGPLDRRSPCGTGEGGRCHYGLPPGHRARHPHLRRQRNELTSRRRPGIGRKRLISSAPGFWRTVGRTSSPPVSTPTARRPTA